MFSQVVPVLWRICRFEAGPQDLPYSQSLARLAAVLAVAGSAVQYVITAAPPMAALVQAVAVVAVMWLFTAQLLHMRGFANRSRQTISALMLVNVLMTLLMLPFIRALEPALAALMADPAAQVQLPVLPTLIVIGLSVWNIAIFASIYRQALDRGIWTGIAAALVMVISASLVGGLVTAPFLA